MYSNYSVAGFKHVFRLNEIKICVFIVVFLSSSAEMVFLHTDIGSSIVKRCMKVPKPMDVCPYLIYL